MGEKVTVMILKVDDLQCPCCYKKVKKILCKFPQIRNQKYDEKANKVTITVVCCNPEKIRVKLCCKGCKVIKSIEIVEPTKPETPKPDPTPALHKPTPTSAPPIMFPCPVKVRCPPRTCCGPCSEGYGGGPCYHGYGVPPPPQPYFDGYYGYAYGYGYGFGYGCGCDRPCRVSRCDY